MICDKFLGPEGTWKREMTLCLINQEGPTACASQTGGLRPVTPLTESHDSFIYTLLLCCLCFTGSEAILKQMGISLNSLPPAVREGIIYLIWRKGRRRKCCLGKAERRSTVLSAPNRRVCSWTASSILTET